MYPAWSPNGQQIAFLQIDENGQNLMVIDINGENRIQITDDGQTNNHSWSPEGSRIAYQSTREDNLDVYTYDLRNDKEYRLTTYEGEDYGPTWDCGGVNIAFSTDRDGYANIYQVFWQGGTPSYLTDHPKTDKWSQWSPAKESTSRVEP